MVCLESSPYRHKQKTEGLPFNCRGNLLPDLLIKLRLQPACLTQRLHKGSIRARCGMEDFAVGEKRRGERKERG